MLNKMIALPPQVRTSQLVSTFLIMLGMVGLATCTILWFGLPTWPVTLWTNIAIVLASGVLYLIAQQGNWQAAGRIAIGLVTLAVAIDSFNPNRTFGLAAPALPLMIVFAAFLFGTRGLFVSVVINIAWVVVVMISKLSLLDLSEKVAHMQVIDSLAYIVYFVATGVVMMTLSRWVGVAQQRVDDAAVQISKRTQELEVEVDRRKVLESEQQQRANELAKLLDISSALSLTLDLPVLLDRILNKLGSVVAFDEAFIAEFTSKHGLDLQIASVAGLYAPSLKGTLLRYDASTDTTIAQLASARESIVCENLASDNPTTASFRQWYVRNYGMPKREMGAAMLVPLVVKGRTTGIMCLCTSRHGYYSQRLAELALAFASQAAAALETVQLHGEAIRAAALNERTRLARDLHDSVSQSLYGIVLGTRTAKATVDPNSQTDQALDYVLRLAESGLTEMRALIYELRPEHLEREGLLGALERQLNAICSRHHIQPVFSIRCSEPDLPLRIKESIYRIVLEAAQNTIKHAKCSELRLDVTNACGALVFTVLDNGTGFDADANFPRNFGLTGMRERAADINGQLTIESTHGVGTIISLSVPTGGPQAGNEQQLALFDSVRAQKSVL
jgi:signal transduction histidine kinase